MFTPLRTLMLAAAVFTGGTAVAINLTSSEAPADRTYVGQETCMQSGCHDGPTGDGSVYAGADKFMETFHQKIHLRPSPETVRIDRYFEEGRVIMDPYAQLGTVEDTLFIKLSKSEDKTEYFAQMWVAGGDSTPKMKVAYTYGGNGWIQRYLAEVNGRYYTLPFQYVLPSYKDYSDTGNTFYFLDLNKWAEGDPNVNPPKMTFFKQDSKQFTNQSWDKNCSPCHVNGFEFEYAVNGTDTVHTALWAGKKVDSASKDINMSIGCESCHGPGSEHAENPTSTNIVSPARWPNTREGFQLKLDLCGQCHNRMKSTGKTYSFPYDEAHDQPYTPGLPMADYIYKGDREYGANIWPDSSEYAHHQQGQDFQRSYGYQNHTIYKGGCWSCHTVHYNKKVQDGKEELPFQLDRNWYSMKDGEGCVSCHGSAGSLFDPPLADFTRDTTWKGRTVNIHTKHSPEISQCVNCHFTKTASISFVGTSTKPLYDFTSHHFFVIRPNLTIQYAQPSATNAPVGQLNTCAESCHRNGRGSRNFRPGDPVAPDFGIVDLAAGFWKEKTDVALADSLWHHYQEMYAGVLSADAVSGPVTGSTAISSVIPNPSHGTTTIRFNMAKTGDVSLEIFNAKGERVRQLAVGRHETGAYSKTWDGLDEMRQPVPAGTYIARLKTASGISSQNVVIVR